ncbi:unnamed protein product [Adineta ricciae]|uniref:Uncharacterized protein n=1 Tax=Adineta ricciae TaxID=249248 RepID=A0A815E5G9_ADIRI|nr:unnamed protein product [Adineta ricciae]CAF1302376.1 unnamed protein product [Adineta ricciae]
MQFRKLRRRTISTSSYEAIIDCWDRVGSHNRAMELFSESLTIAQASFVPADYQLNGTLHKLETRHRNREEYDSAL